MSTLLELSSIAKFQCLKEHVIVLLIGELDNCLGSTTAYESSKLLRDKNDVDLAKARFGAVSFSCYSKGDMKFRDRVFPHMVGLTITSLDLLGVIEDEEYFSKLCDADAIRVCLLLCLEVIFMGRFLVTGVDDTLMRLVDSLESWNAFPWGEHIWMHLYDEIMNVAFKDLSPIFDLIPTLAEGTNLNGGQVPMIFCKLCRLISTANTNVPRSNISSLKDSIIKELNSCIFKLEAIIQVLGRERNGNVVEKLQFSGDFCHVSVEFCNELNQAFVKLFESSIIDNVGTPLDADTQVEFGETEDYLVEEEFIRRLEEQERLLLEEESLNEEEIRVRLEEQKRVRLVRGIFRILMELESDSNSITFESGERLLLEEEGLNEEEIRVRLEEQKQLRIIGKAVRTNSWFKVCSKFDKKESFGLVDQDMTEFLKNVKPWVKDLSRINSAIDNIWISEDLDIYLGKPGYLRCKFPWSKEVCVDRRFWESLVCLDPPRQGWLLDEVRLPEVPELLNVLDKKAIDKSTYQITFSIAENVPKQGGVFGDCGVWVCIFLYRLAHGISLDVEDPVQAALVYRERMTQFYYNHKVV
ncbi:phospholipase-like protein [Tanacetum coccineum]|uniref:Phospholipase-like protein n=1 Tax=Tanacetum coccineum TaxID=301880 RepID=A0ABQ5EKA4_9ASTR